MLLWIIVVAVIGLFAGSILALAFMPSSTLQELQRKFTKKPTKNSSER